MPRTSAAWRKVRQVSSSTATRAAGYGLGMRATVSRVAPLCKCVHVLAVCVAGHRVGRPAENSGGCFWSLSRLRGMSDMLLTVGDVAEMCQVHRKTVTRAIG